MFTAMACATVALVVFIERRRHGFNRGSANGSGTPRDYSQIGSFLPFAILIALGVIADRFPW